MKKKTPQPYRVRRRCISVIEWRACWRRAPTPPEPPRGGGAPGGEGSGETKGKMSSAPRHVSDCGSNWVWRPLESYGPPSPLPGAAPPRGPPSSPCTRSPLRAPFDGFALLVGGSGIFQLERCRLWCSCRLFFGFWFHAC